MPHPSLRSQLLGWLVPAMLALLAAGAATAYWVALRSATLAYDRSLLDTALAISEQLRVVDGEPQLKLAPQAKAVLLTDKFDRIFYAVRDADNQTIDGEPGLSLPPRTVHSRLQREGREYYDDLLNGQPVRVAALHTSRGDSELTILAAETLVKRNALVREILLGMLVPELVLIAATLLVVWFGVRSGLRPLDGLRHELAGRSHADLRPLTTTVPEEIAPVVGEINDLMRRLDHALDSQRHFVSDAAHQLRTPIAALLAQVEVALRGDAPLSRQQLESILSATRRLSHLVDQLLALARAEPALRPSESAVALDDVVREVAETWLPAAIARGIDLGFELSPATVSGNRLLLQEMLANLIDNALRHTPRGGSVTVSCRREADAVMLSVEDSGTGIAPEERERVFERFYQSPGNRGEEGCGLGLAIVRQIARQHSGEAGIGRSETLGGACLEIRLPAASGAPG